MSALSTIFLRDLAFLLFPNDRSGQLLAFYMDDSADAKRQTVFVVAGIIADSEVWFEVERHWTRRLTDEGLSYFRATEFNSLTGEFRKLVAKFGPAEARRIATSLVADLKLIIKSANVSAFCFIGPLAPYRTVQATEYGAFVLQGDPYIQAHELIIFNVARSCAQNGVKPPVAYVFDEHSKAKELMSKWAEFKEHHPICAPWMGTLTAADDKRCPAIQMADLMANTTKRAFETIRSDSTAGLAELEEWRSILDWVAYWDEGYLRALVDASIDVATSPVPLEPRRLIDL
jgi:hypothetical protein